MNQAERGFLGATVALSLLWAQQAAGETSDDLDALFGQPQRAQEAEGPHRTDDEASRAGSPGQEDDAESSSPASIPVGQGAPVGKPAASPRGNRIVEEIVVTAQKREENVQDVPISIAAFSGEALDARGIANVADLQQVTAGMQFSTYAGYPLLYLRGIGTDVFLPTADPSVTTYIDGVYVPTSQGVVQAFGGIERVEVLKGPQGTLFGRNSTGGAISIVTKKPGDTCQASAQAALGNFNERRGKAYLTAPLTDWLGVNLDMVATRLDHQYTHVDGKAIEPETSMAGRLRANWHPADTFDLDLSYLKVENAGASTQVIKNIKPSVLGLLVGGPAQQDDYVLESDHLGSYDASHEMLTAAATYQVPWFDLKLIGSEQEVRSFDTSIDFDASARPAAVFAADNQFTHAQTLELQLLSNAQWGHPQLEWIAGAYLLRADAGVDPGRFQGGPNALSALGLPAALREALVTPVAPNPDDGLELILSGRMRTRSLSFFAQGSWDLPPRWQMTLGGRWQTEQRDVYKSQTEVATGPDSSELLFDFPDQSKSYTNFSPKLSLSYRPDEASLLYLTAAQGFKSGTFNVVTIYTPGAYVRPEEVTTVDLGIKTQLFERSLQLNAALFASRIQDLQASFVSFSSGGAIQFENAGRARVLGAEFDLTWLPMPHLNPGLVVTANGAYLDSEYADYPNGSGYDESTGTFSGGNDFSGNKITRSPEFTGGLGFAQLLPVGTRHELELGVDGYFNTGFFYDAQNANEEPAYALLNARISWLYRPWTFRLTAFGRNVLDETYHLQLFSNDFGVASTLAYPAQYGLRASWSF